MQQAVAAAWLLLLQLLLLAKLRSHRHQLWCELRTLLLLLQLLFNR
jgi:hypothetical protein